MKSKLVRRNSITVQLKTHFHYFITKRRPHKRYSAEAVSLIKTLEAAHLTDHGITTHKGQISADHDEDDVTQNTKKNFFFFF